MPTITFLNGEKKFYHENVTVLNIAQDIKYSFKKICVGAYINGLLVDSNTIVENDSIVSILTIHDFEAFNIFKNTFIHLLGYAITLCFPQAKLLHSGITNSGFYYDIDNFFSVNKNDIKNLQNCMHALIKKKYNISKITISYSVLKKILVHCKNKYKIMSIIKKFSNIKKYNLYFHEEHFDFFLNPQVRNISMCKYFILDKVSSIHCKVGEVGKIAQRIHGVGYLNKKDFNSHLKNVAELKKRDHREIGKKLNLYHIQDDSPGMIFWHENGLIIYKSLENFIRGKLKKYLYIEVKTPILMNRSIWERTGHWDNYKDSLFSLKLDNKNYCIKPMNCPGHIEIFKKGLKSYRDLPIRMAEFGYCHRNESSGSLHGLLRVRSFTQDDAHIFCTKRHIKKEINNCIKMIYEIYNVFGFSNIQIDFSTRPENRIGDDSIWDCAEKDLETVLADNNLMFNYKKGEGAFYGPKIEFILKDSLNRKWQCGTIQLDFYLSSRLDIFYIDKNNKKKCPIIIHRAILGSIERFIGILIEEYVGNLPTWLAPIQIIILSVNNKHDHYVRKIFKKFYIVGLRIQMNLKCDSVSLKVREAILQKIPYIMICGDQEVQNNSISVRNRLGKKFILTDINNFITRLKKLISICSFNLLEE
ncbi:threonine--tRNA ligase [Buchnera aphidicola (Mollitrichosiphum nigrofasciatum)]|uniref:threonine--tRNA ligase n=1 Tax=Buchnera aphidicola TaxID=9 RepID=UPI0031B80B27